MKTIIRGVILRDYLTIKTLISKTVGLAMTQGSGVPIGTMGPFVHIASIVANQLSILAGQFDPVFLSESRRAECLVAACAVGVACTFSLPVGGRALLHYLDTTPFRCLVLHRSNDDVLLCEELLERLLCCLLWGDYHPPPQGICLPNGRCLPHISSLKYPLPVTVTAFFQTSFKPDSFGVHELPFFVLLGILCGVLGAGYIRCYRALVMFLRNNRAAKFVFQQQSVFFPYQNYRFCSWIVYPLFVSIVFSLVSFPHGLGEFTSGRVSLILLSPYFLLFQLKFSNNLRDFFSNCTFSENFGSEHACPEDVSPHWREKPAIPTLLLFLIFHVG